LDYLEHGIPWATVQRMLIDAPGVEEKAKQQSVEMALTDENAGEIMELLNSFNK
jgi:hypothetical protein